MNRFILLLMTCLATASTIAQDTTATEPTEPSEAGQELALRLITLTNAPEVVDQMEQRLQSGFQNFVAQMSPTPEQRPVVEQYLSRANSLVDESMDWQSMQPEVIGIYTSTFSEEELSQLVAFYESPLGEKMVNRMPEVMRATMQLAQLQMQQVLPELQTLSQELAGELGALPAQE